MDGKIELDIGGKLFITSLSSLRWGSAYFQNMFGSSWKESISNEGTAVFIDRGKRKHDFLSVLNFRFIGL
jgi:hypothetical protein